MLLHTTGLLAAPALFLILTYVVRTLRRPSSRLPGPWMTKWTGLVATYYWITARKARWVQDLHEKYGPVVRIAPDEIDICDIDAAKEIYNVKETYIKSQFYRIMSTAGVINVFNVIDIAQHRRYRRLLSNPMAEGSLKQMHPTIKAKVDLAMDGMHKEMKTRGAVDIHKWWMFMTTDVIGELSFGEPFHMLEQGEKNQYSIDLESVGFMSALRAVFPRTVYLAQRFSLPIPIIQDAAATTKRMFRYASESLQRHYNSTDEKPTLFNKIYKAGEEDFLSFTEIRDTALAYIVAGTDTTATTLTYLIWAVCRDHNIQRKLVEELGSLREGFDDADLKGLVYLGCVVDEALRLYSAVPAVLPRVVPPGGATLAGYRFEQGTVVSCQAYSLHRDANVFVDPERFRPERWEGATKEMRDAFHPFGGGARICLGIHLAKMELRLATARFFRAFPEARVSKKEGMSDDDMAEKIYLLLSPKGKRCLVELW